MLDTSASLLQRLRADAGEDDWRRLVELYTPLIRGWLHRHGLSGDDHDDLAQDVLTVVVRRLPEFRHNSRVGAFRTWLKAITVNCVRDHWKASRRRPAKATEAVLDELADPDSALSRAWDADHDKHVAGQLLAQLRPQFEPATWEAFRRVAMAGESADAVAADLGLTVNAVYIAKSRVMAKLRHEAAGLLGDD